MYERMKDTLYIPVVAGAVLAFTIVVAAIGANDASIPFTEAEVATRPIGKEYSGPLMAGTEAKQMDSRLPR